MQIQVEKSKIHRVKVTGAGRKVSIKDSLILIAYALMEVEEVKVFKPSLVFPDEATNLLK